MSPNIQGMKTERRRKERQNRTIHKQNNSRKNSRTERLFNCSDFNCSGEKKVEITKIKVYLKFLNTRDKEKILKASRLRGQNN